VDLGMPIPGVEQPEFIIVSDDIRLRKFDNKYDFALEWYQDPETLMLVDGVTKPYDTDMLQSMYTCLEKSGELYFIEIFDGEKYIPIGDVTFSSEDMPIVIGVKSYWGKGIGKKVVKALVERGKQLGYTALKVREVYKYNIASQKMFESVGFSKYEETENGYRYILEL